MSLKRTFAAVAISAAALLSFAPVSASADPAPHSHDFIDGWSKPGQNVRITQMGTDAAYSDTLANRNQEFVDIQNNGGPDVTVTGWILGDNWSRGNDFTQSCNRFVFGIGNVDASMVSGADVKIPSGHTVRVYTGSGTASVDGSLHKVYINSPVGCGTNGHFWTNGTDRANLVKKENPDAADYVATAVYNRLGGYEVKFV